MSVLPFFHLLEKLKTTPRTGWINEGIEHPESIADHMYRMSIMTMACSDEKLDKSRMMKIALVHDMAEAIVGDITPVDQIPKERKQQMELEAMEKICNQLLPPESKGVSEEIMALFLEYENKATPEACFVKDVDKYELVLQLHEYEKSGRLDRPLASFAASGEQIVHPQVKEWCQEVYRAREKYWAGRNAENESMKHDV